MVNTAAYLDGDGGVNEADERGGEPDVGGGAPVEGAGGPDDVGDEPATADQWCLPSEFLWLIKYNFD